MCPAAEARVPRGPRPQHEGDEQDPGRRLEPVGGRGWGVLRRRTSAGTRPGGRENPICSAVAAGGPAVPWPARHAGWTRLKTVQRTPRGRALRGRTPERPRIRPWVRSGRGGSRYVQWQRAGICAVKRVRPMTSTTPGRSLCVCAAIEGADRGLRRVGHARAPAMPSSSSPVRLLHPFSRCS